MFETFKVERVGVPRASRVPQPLCFFVVTITKLRHCFQNTTSRKEHCCEVSRLFLVIHWPLPCRFYFVVMATTRPTDFSTNQSTNQPRQTNQPAVTHPTKQPTKHTNKPLDRPVDQPTTTKQLARWRKDLQILLHHHTFLFLVLALLLLEGVAGQATWRISTQTNSSFVYLLRFLFVHHLGSDGRHRHRHGHYHHRRRSSL